MGPRVTALVLETGTSPMAWLTDARLDRARELLELTDEPVENLGRLTRLGSPASVVAAPFGVGRHRELPLLPDGLGPRRCCRL